MCHQRSGKWEGISKNRKNASIGKSIERLFHSGKERDTEEKNKIYLYILVPLEALGA